MSETTFTMGNATFQAGKPAPDTQGLCLGWGWHWGGAQGHGEHSDPIRDFSMMCEAAPMRIGHFEMSGEAFAALREHPTAGASVREAGGRFYLMLFAYGEVPVTVRDRDDHVVQAMSTQRLGTGQFAEVEWARLTGAIQDDEHDVTVRIRCAVCGTEATVNFTGQERRDARARGEVPLRDAPCACGGFKISAPPMPPSFNW